MVEHAARGEGLTEPHEGFTRGVHVPGPTRGWLFAIAGGALAGGIGVAVLATRSSHFDFAPALIGLGLLTGWSFIASGLVALRRRPQNRFGWLLVASGFAWFAAALPASNWSPLFTIGLLVSPIWAALFVHTILAFPSGRVEGRVARATVALAYGGFVLLQLPYVLVDDPDRQLDCPCPDNLLLATDNRAAAGLINVVQVTVAGLLVAAMVVYVLARRWRAASPPLRRTLAPFLVTGTLTILLLVFGYALSGVGFDPLNPLVLVGFVGLAAVPVAFLSGLLRSRLARVGVGDLVIELRSATTPGHVEAALERALGDPSLVLAYWLPDEGRYVNAEGAPVEVPEGGVDRGVRIVEQEGERVAALVYDGSLEEERELVDSASAAAAMALENARLQAETRAHLAELRASRARIVEAGDVERRRLERDLHDGAQQRFVTLSLALSLVEKRLESDPAQAGQLLTEAKKELVEGLDELRELAHGIHPAALSQGGLGLAVETLAARSPVPVTLDVTLHERLPEPVEVAGYFVVSEALTNVAKYAQASAVIVALARRNEILVVEVRDNGVGGASADEGSGLRGLTDRVEALGGQLSVRSPAGGGTTVRAEIPCA
jgi:signal transduction histidine kinase